MRKKLTADISANTFQVILNQLSGILIFYFCSKFLDKANFGEINWSTALLYTSFSILGSGIDQMTVKKIASGHHPGSLAKLYLFHVLFTGLFFYLLLLSGSLLFRDFFGRHYLLIALGISQFLLFLSTPFKQVATGQERFHVLLYMSTCSNIVKAAGVLALGIAGRLSIQWVVWIFIAGAAIELGLCVYLSRALLKSSMTLPFSGKAYRGLIRESLPQLGSTIFNSAVARFDWILLGLISTSVVLAEYSFAYKVFEISTLPLLVLGPLLLPKFSRIFHDASQPDLLMGEGELLVLLRVEMILSSFIALLLNMLWDPFIDGITGGKYGAVNILIILVLSGCMPFLYLTNFLWTVNFAKGRLKEMFFIIMITFLINMVGDIVLIPFLHGLGAAIAYLAAIVIQTLLYTGLTRIGSFQKAWQSLLFCAGSAVLSGSLAKHFCPDVILRVACCCCCYAGLLWAAGQLRPTDWRILKMTAGL